MNEKTIITQAKNPEGDTVTRLTGNMHYEIDLTDISHACNLQVSNENNFIALVMTRDMLSSLIKRQNLPTTQKKHKLSEKEFELHIKARNMIEDLCNGMAAHLLQEAKELKIKPRIHIPEKPKIILPGQ